MSSHIFDLEVIRTAMLANLAAIAEAFGLQQVAYALAEPTPPTMQIAGVSDIMYDVAMQRGGDQNMVIVQAFVGMGSDIAAQQSLDRLLKSSGPTSVKEAIESDPTLGDTVDDLRVVRCTGHQFFMSRDGLKQVVGSTWTVQVETTG